MHHAKNVDFKFLSAWVLDALGYIQCVNLTDICCLLKQNQMATFV